MLLVGVPCTAALGPEVALGPSGLPQTNVRIASASGHLLAVWFTNGRLIGRVDGSPIDLSLVSNLTTLIGIAGGRSNFLIAYQAPSSDPTAVILAVRVGFDGRVLDSAPIVAMREGHQVRGGGAVAYDGSEFVIVSMLKLISSSVALPSDIITARVSDDGQAHDGARFQSSGVSGIPRSPHITWAAGQFFIGYTVQMFQDDNLGPWGASALPLEPQQIGMRPLIAPVFIDGHVLAGLKSDLAVGGDRLTFAWVGSNGGVVTITVAEMDYEGRTVLPPTVVAVVAAAPSAAFSNIAIAWDGSEYLVAWAAPSSSSSQDAVRGLRFRYDGTLIDAKPFDISPNSAFADISLVAIPDGFAIAYTRTDDSYDGNSRAFVRIIDRVPLSERRRAAR